MPRISPERMYHGLVNWKRRDSRTGVETSGTYDLGSPSHSVFSWSRAYTGSRTSGYYTLSRQSKYIPPLGHSVVGYTSNGKGSSNTEIYRSPDPLVPSYTIEYTTSNSLVLFGRPGVSHLPEAYIKARASLAKQVNDMKVNLGQAFAERKQTANLLADTASRVAGMARELRRGNIPNFLNSMSKKRGDDLLKRVRKTPPDKRVAQHWLELQYGWKPLMQDAHGAVELLNSSLDNGGFHYVRAKANHNDFAYSAGTPGTGYGYKQTRKTQTKFGCAFRLDSASRAGLAQTGLDNPALLAWELMPYSFVIDWFIPVGNYLEALNAFSGFEFVNGWQSQKNESE